MVAREGSDRTRKGADMTEAMVLAKACGMSPARAVIAMDELRYFGYTLRSTTPVRETSLARTQRILEGIIRKNGECPECQSTVVNGVCQSNACKGRLL